MMLPLGIGIHDEDDLVESESENLQEK